MQNKPPLHRQRGGSKDNGEWGGEVIVKKTMENNAGAFPPRSPALNVARHISMHLALAS